MNLELMSRLQAFELDTPGVALPFSHRLAHENGWSREFSLLVLKEYRRFLYLCVEARHPVTPSDAVDQAWHLHMCYTRSYWEDLCDGVLGCNLHHGPTKGGTDENAKFHNWYERTLASYHEAFGEPAPQEIWPAPSIRFSPVDFRRIDCTNHFVIPRQRLRSAAMLAIGTVASVVLVAGCTASISSDGTGAIASVILLVFFVLVTVTILGKLGGGSRGRRRGKRKERGSGSWFDSGCGAGGDSHSGCSSDSGCSSGCGGGGCGGGCGGD